MFNVNTTLVLGAGASSSYGYPLGDGLIADIMQFCTKFISSEDTTGNMDPYRRLKDALEFYDPISIDSFLFHFKNDKELVKASKIAISQVILQSAQKRLFNRRDSKGTHWMRFLWNGIISNRSVEDLILEDIPLNFNIITFNYDASLEYFLYSRVNSSLSMFEREDREKFLKKLQSKIHHVYGCVMDYQWMGGGDENNLYDDWGEGVTYKRALDYYQRIHLINERSDNDYSRTQKILQQSRQVIFLGFGFDDTNIGQNVLDISRTLTGIPESNNSGKKHFPVIKYTNYGGSKLIDDKVNNLILRFRKREDKEQNERDFVGPLRDFGIVASSKNTYEALSEDFNLTNI